MLRADLAAVLRQDGHDVVRASEVGDARADDATILDRAKRDGRILVTLDAHFGDWTVLPLSTHPGVIRLRAHPTTTANVASVLLPLLRGREGSELANQLVIASSKGSRWIRTGS